MSEPVLLPNPARALVTFPFIVYAWAPGHPHAAIAMCVDEAAVRDVGMEWMFYFGAGPGVGVESLDLRTWRSGPGGGSR